MRRASCTATSSPATSCSARTVRPRSPTSASPGRPATSRSPRPVSSLVRPHTCHRRPLAARSPAPRRTFSRALGATLYAAVEGEPPFGRDDNTMALLHLIATGKVNPPRRAGVLANTLQKMLRDDPSTRPTMKQLSEELAAVAKGVTEVAPAPRTPVSAPPRPAPPPPPAHVRSPQNRPAHVRREPTRSVRVPDRKWSATNRWLVITAVAAVVVILASIGGARLLAHSSSVNQPNGTLQQGPPPTRPPAHRQKRRHPSYHPSRRHLRPACRPRRRRRTWRGRS